MKLLRTESFKKDFQKLPPPVQEKFARAQKSLGGEPRLHTHWGKTKVKGKNALQGIAGHTPFVENVLREGIWI